VKSAPAYGATKRSNDTIENGIFILNILAARYSLIVRTMLEVGRVSPPPEPFTCFKIVRATTGLPEEQQPAARLEANRRRPWCRIRTN